MPRCTCGQPHSFPMSPRIDAETQALLISFLQQTSHQKVNSIPSASVFGLHKVTTKQTEDGFSYILFSRIYPVNMDQNSSTLREHYFHRQIKRKLSHPCLFGHTFLKATCQGMNTPPVSDKYCAHYLNNPGGHCQVVGEKVSIFALLPYTLL